MVFIMKNVIGIDIGGSTTKIVGFSDGGELIEPMAVKAPIRLRRHTELLENLQIKTKYGLTKSIGL